MSFHECIMSMFDYIRIFFFIILYFVCMIQFHFKIQYFFILSTYRRFFLCFFISIHIWFHKWRIIFLYQEIVSIFYIFFINSIFLHNMKWIIYKSVPIKNIVSWLFFSLLSENSWVIFIFLFQISYNCCNISISRFTKYNDITNIIFFIFNITSNPKYVHIFFRLKYNNFLYIINLVFIFFMIGIKSNIHIFFFINWKTLLVLMMWILYQ